MNMCLLNMIQFFGAIYIGVRKNWQERWFVLDFASQLLTYFESKEVRTYNVYT